MNSQSHNSGTSGAPAVATPSLIGAATPEPIGVTGGFAAAGGAAGRPGPRGRAWWPVGQEEMRRAVTMSNLEQPLFDGAEATNRDLVDYLEAIGERLVPVFL